MVSFIQPTNVLTLYRGQTKRIDLALTDEDGSALDLTTARIFFTVTKNPEDANPVFRKDSANGSSEIEITFPKLGEIIVFVSANDTITLEEGRYFYDIWVEIVTGQEITRFPVIEPTYFIVKAAPSRFPRT